MLKLRKVMATLAWIGWVLFLSACSDAMSCSSDEAKRLVFDIAAKSTHSTPVNSEEGKLEYEYSLVNIRNEPKGNRLNSLTCAAKLNILTYVTIYKNKDALIDEQLADTVAFFNLTGINIKLNERTSYRDYTKKITYKLEVTPEGRLYATVYGLP